MYEYINYSLFSPFIITRNVSSMVAPNSGNTNKKGQLTAFSLKGGSGKLTAEILKIEEKELEWLSGFSEAESSFNISKKGALKFKIKLHCDDRQTLVYIQKLLNRLANRTIGVIVDSKNYHESYYSVDKLQDIIEIINPIFTKYHFTTSKYLDFLDFKAATNIKIISHLAKKKVKFSRIAKNFKNKV